MNYNDFIEYLSSKRYTKARIKRMLVYILLNVTKDLANKAYNENLTIRLLAS